MRKRRDVRRLKGAACLWVCVGAGSVTRVLGTDRLMAVHYPAFMRANFAYRKLRYAIEVGCFFVLIYLIKSFNWKAKAW